MHACRLAVETLYPAKGAFRALAGFIAWYGANTACRRSDLRAAQQLLEQVWLGEATHREDLVRQSLYRPELIESQ